MLVNVGRGKHVVDKDLIAALDSGQLSHAALDALWPEPLPPVSPLWLHPKVTVMPHVARRPTGGHTGRSLDREGPGGDLHQTYSWMLRVPSSRA